MVGQMLLPAIETDFLIFYDSIKIFHNYLIFKYKMKIARLTIIQIA